MLQALDTRSAKTARARLMNPANAKHDPGIDLRRHRRPTWTTPYVTDVTPAAFLDLPLNIADHAQIALSRVELAACVHFGVTKADLHSSCRTLRISRARKIAMYLCEMLTGHTVSAIGRHFGGREYLTAFRSIERVKKTRDRSVLSDIAAIKGRLGAL